MRGTGDEGTGDEGAGDEGAGNTCSPPREAKQHTWLQSGSAHGGGSFTQFQLYLTAVQLNSEPTQLRVESTEVRAKQSPCAMTDQSTEPMRHETL